MSLKLTVTEENGVTLSATERVTLEVAQVGPQGPAGSGGGGGSGDVVGPASSTDGRAVLFDGTTGKLIKQASAAPMLVGDAPTAHAASHQDGGTDELALDASQTTSGTFNVARLGTGTPTAYTVLDGTGAWTDNVPVFVPVKNTSGSTIAKGAPVYATGSVGASGAVEVAPADCDDAAKMPAIGLLDSQLANNATGYAVVVGLLRGVDTSAYSINASLYVSTTAGQLTGTKPTGTSELIQNIGRVVRVNASNGEILVLGPGRTNDVPNAIDAGKITSGTVNYSRLPVGTTSSTVAAGDDSRITGAVPTTRTVNGKALSSDITLSASDVGALASNDASVTNARVPQWRRLTFSNADYDLSSTPNPAISGSTVLQQTGTISAPRTVTLPLAANVPAGSEIIINVGAGVTGTNTVSIARSGSDLINGASTSLAIGTAWGQRRLVSDGVSNWVHDDGLMRRSQNLADVSDAATARTNLGLGTAGGDLTGTYPNPTVATGLAVSKLANGTRGQALIGGASTPEFRFITTSQAVPAAANDWVPLWGPFGSGTTTSTVGGSATASNSAARYLPFFVGKRIGVTGLGIEVAVGNAGASAVIRMGIHNDSSGRPGTVAQDAGTATAAAAAKEITFTEVFLDTGWYWAVLVFQSLDTSGTNPTLRCANTANGSIAPRTAVPTGAAQTQLFGATVSGALAANPTVSAATTAIVPCIWLKVSTA